MAMIFGGGIRISGGIQITPGIGGGSPSPSPTYSVAANGGVTSINEGSSLTFNVVTTLVDNGTILYWTANNVSTSNADFSSYFGLFTITNSTSSFVVTPVADVTTEGSETFTVSVRTVSTSGTVVATSTSITVNDTSVSPSPYNANYLIVAGGGGGGSPNGPSWNVATGRGGAGGVLQGCVTLIIGTTYTVSVGSGGGSGTNGNPSTFSAVPTVAVGGGAGGRAGYYQPGGPGFPGGSGGGGGGYYPFTPCLSALPAGTGTPGQGYPGGGIFGGGAGGAGTPTLAGAGYAWPVTGSTYGSGGCGTPSVAGKGGGGCGGTAQDGKVIIAVPNAGYSGTYSPSPAITISTCGPGYPGKTLITFNGSGNYTA